MVLVAARPDPMIPGPWEATNARARGRANLPQCDPRAGDETWRRGSIGSRPCTSSSLHSLAFSWSPHGLLVDSSGPRRRGADLTCLPRQAPHRIHVHRQQGGERKGASQRARGPGRTHPCHCCDADLAHSQRSLEDARGADPRGPPETTSGRRSRILRSARKGPIRDIADWPPRRR
jgi:hypothetical protein